MQYLINIDIDMPGVVQIFLKCFTSYNLFHKVKLILCKYPKLLQWYMRTEVMKPVYIQ